MGLGVVWGWGEGAAASIGNAALALEPANADKAGKASIAVRWLNILCGLPWRCR